MWTRHPKVPWVVFAPAQQGGFFAQNTRTGVQVHAPDELSLHQFAADSARSDGHYGLGDLVERAAHALGFEQCSPCAERQAALNRMAPRVLRRR
jgi:hypothetical protein